jgi:CBS domain-containing protein
MRNEGGFSMPVGEICTREVAVADREMTIQEAALVMRQHHVGNLVVVDSQNGKRVPVGIVTDRDIVVSVVATKLDAAIFTVGDLAMQKVTTCREDEGVLECIQRMRTKGVRRMPVVDREGNLSGIVAVDDLLQLLAVEMNAIGKLISREQVHEAAHKR